MSANQERDCEAEMKLGIDMEMETGHKLVYQLLPSLRDQYPGPDRAKSAS